MWKIPALLFVLGSASLWLPAGGAITVRPEDDILTPSVEGGLVSPGVEDNILTPEPGENTYEPTGATGLVPTRTEGITDVHLEDKPTAAATAPDREGSQSTSSPNVPTSHSMERVSEETEVTIEKDGLATVTLVGIIVGVLLSIGFVGGIILVVVRKMSGRP
ncbi:PREDICTED: podoplanin isoform X2 [Condylura cristata]|uniref:podoplanin isoform X2 n=1 Tax=Condylura cristata TaxID=143302 RepID=UPI00064297E9|nr:PREDICTED: podoplanin isoform X2 [Condylura cristata]